MKQLLNILLVLLISLLCGLSYGQKLSFESPKGYKIYADNDTSLFIEIGKFNDSIETKIHSRAIFELLKALEYENKHFLVIDSVGNQFRKSKRQLNRDGALYGVLKGIPIEDELFDFKYEVCTVDSIPHYHHAWDKNFNAFVLTTRKKQ